MFDWIAFLDARGIEYVTKGHNASKNHVGIPCPWCGTSDPSHHMGIDLRGYGYNCYRDSSHSGKSPARLIVALTGCTYEQARMILENEDVPLPTTDETFETDMMTRLGGSVDRKLRATGKLALLPEFKPITNKGLCRTLILPYLRKRGYSERGALNIADRFSLHYATSGKFAYRIIIPIYQDKQLVTWTSRTITNDELRYRTLSYDPETAKKSGLPIAPMNIKECVFDYDELLSGGKTLVVTEGPFDAMRITYYGEEYGILGTCLFSTSMLPAQMERLLELSSKFNRMISLMDSEVGMRAFRMFPDKMAADVMSLPHGINDPAELRWEHFRELFGI
jgi:hypothetical protein